MVKNLEFESISELKKLLAQNYKIEKVEPHMFTSNAEVNIVQVTLVSTDGKTSGKNPISGSKHAN
jgi:hypothetical protein